MRTGGRAAAGGGRRIAFLLASSLLLAGCGSDTPRVTAAHGARDSATLELVADTCNAHPTAEVEERDDEVRVLLGVSRSWGDADCADSVVVTLARALGTRAVVDASTDRRVEVFPPR